MIWVALWLYVCGAIVTMGACVGNGDSDREIWRNTVLWPLLTTLVLAKIVIASILKRVRK